MLGLKVLLVLTVRLGSTMVWEGLRLARACVGEMEGEGESEGDRLGLCWGVEDREAEWVVEGVPG
jgi:hypothetical protein